MRALGLMTLCCLLGSAGCGSSEHDAAGAADAAADAVDASRDSQDASIDSVTAGEVLADAVDETADAFPGFPPAAYEAACSDYAASLCDRSSTCAYLVFAARWGDATRCRARNKALCMITFSAPGSAYAPAALAGCAKTMSSASCGEYLNGKIGACSVPGKLGVGGRCLYSEQCASRACTRKPGACGTCAARAALGESCPTIPCGSGLWCSSSGKCAPTAALGETCEGYGSCEAGTDCIGGKCTAQMKLGETCDPIAKTAPRCIDTKCDDATKVCVAVTFAAVGEACSYSSAPYRWCTGGDTCTSVTSTGTCVASSPAGGKCSTTPTGPSCEVPAECDSGYPLGTCTVLDPASCK